MQQRYSYLGIIIVLAMSLIAAWLIWAFFAQPKPPIERPEILALRLQCEERHGMLAVSTGDWVWAECYQGRKKLWGVRL